MNGRPTSRAVGRASGGKDIVNVVGNNYAFAAINKVGKVTTWGDSGKGGDSTTVAHELSKDTSALASYSLALAWYPEDLRPDVDLNGYCFIWDL